MSTYSTSNGDPNEEEKDNSEVLEGQAQFKKLNLHGGITRNS
jgi:hypothetical protein